MKAHLKSVNGKLPPTFLKMATVSTGYMLGQEDIIKNRKFSTSVRCLTRTSTLYSISKADFLWRMQRHVKIWSEIVSSSRVKDSITMSRIY